MTGKTPPLVPKLRFPEFHEAGEWSLHTLGSVAEPIYEKVGSKKCVPMSVTTGVGLLSQEEKFGRVIAGESYANYIKLQTDDFAYNKSATKEFPQGYIARYTGTRDAGVPNSIFTCFRPDTGSVVPEFLDHLFHGNHHGRWLRTYITVGARAHGALSVSDDDLFAMPIPLPPESISRDEQQKIADCLGSLDDLIAAEGRKLEALRRHKEGLMQQLFPQPGETVPRRRFPDFEDAPEWERQTLGEAATFLNGRAYSKDELLDSGKYRVLRVGNFFTNDHWYYSDLELDEDKYCDNGDLLYAWSASFGPRIWRGERVIYHYHIWKVVERGRIDRGFLYACLECETQRIRDASARGLGMQHLTKAGIESWECAIPTDPDEQRRIAECLCVAEAGVDAQDRLLDALQRHKRGLLQQLFPAPEEESR